MSTNLFATIIVTLSTNIAWYDDAPKRYVSIPCPDGQIGCLVNHSRLEPTGESATKKWSITTVTEETTATVDFFGVAHQLKSTRLLSALTNFFERKEEWIPATLQGRVQTVNGSVYQDMPIFTNPRKEGK